MKVKHNSGVCLPLDEAGQYDPMNFTLTGDEEISYRVLDHYSGQPSIVVELQDEENSYYFHIPIRVYLVVYRIFGDGSFTKFFLDHYNQIRAESHDKYGKQENWIVTDDPYNWLLNNLDEKAIRKAAAVQMINSPQRVITQKLKR